jgi:hypothetical protein
MLGITVLCVRVWGLLGWMFSCRRAKVKMQPMSLKKWV